MEIEKEIRWKVTYYYFSTTKTSVPFITEPYTRTALLQAINSGEVELKSDFSGGKPVYDSELFMVKESYDFYTIERA